MKFLASVPTAAKIGGAGVLGGSGIVGTGLLINDRMNKSKNITSSSEVEDLDQDLKNESDASLKVDSDGAKFKIGETDNKQATLTIKAASSDTVNGKFRGNKWTCTIKGIVKNVNLTSDNFNIDEQTGKFTNDLLNDAKKKGFIDSCKKFRKEEQKTSSGWTSEIVVELEKTNVSNKDTYVFSDTNHVNKIFDGTFSISS